jgi:Nif-specific regulatory protein
MAARKSSKSPGFANQKRDSNIAYLVIRDGQKWSDVFRLMPGRTVTIGRSPNSQIVIKEDQASRQHAEIFLSEGKWVLRDLNSRNGTAVGKERVLEDHSLSAGDVIWIAGTQMAFVTDLSKAYERKVFSKVEIGGETVVGLEVDDSNSEATLTDFRVSEPTNIAHRKLRTDLLHGDDVPGEGDASRNATQLCRLAFDLAKERTPRAIAKMALDCLFQISTSDAGSVMMVPPKRPTTVDPENFEILAWRSDERPKYQRVSRFLAETVLRRGEAVLARDVQDDSALGLRDDSGQVLATSVIAAPIRMDKRSIGLIHLYSTEAQKPLNSEDLEFALAVAETVAMAFKIRFREQKLVEDLSKTKTQVDQLRNQLNVQSEIIGSSEAIFRVHDQISRAAPSKATVLIRGESGVGKELVARAVHFSSDRKSQPFVCLNCAALSESLLESELFGHEKGAFTGATDRKAGKFEAADKGTLMLDEIGEMSPSIQAKFLRVLEGHPFERVGGSKAITVSVRVIAATNRDLEEAVRNGTFRKDLFFRLHVVQIDVPPLRHRAEDVMELAQYFLQKYNTETGRKIQGFAPQAEQQLKRYRWPGNVRELKNVIERAVVLSRGNIIQLEELSLTNLTTASESNFDMRTIVQEYQPESLEVVEQRHIEATLLSTGWNKSKSASILGIERSTLDRKIKKYGIQKEEA